MKKFMGDNFLLNTESAKKLYHDYAETMPILDYHCHINPEQIANDYRFKTITEAWLGGDHYKWRMMRNAGVDERYIGVGHCILGYAANEAPAPKPRKNDYVIYR